MVSMDTIQSVSGDIGGGLSAQGGQGAGNDAG
jgi:hypothetical protein